MTLSRLFSLVSGSGPKATWVVIIIAFCGILISNALWLIPSLNDARIHTANLRLEVARRAADSIEAHMDAKIRALQNSADILRFDKSSARDIFGRLLKENPGFNAVSLSDANFMPSLTVSRFDVLEVSRPGIPTVPAMADGEDGRTAFLLGPVTRTKNLDPVVHVAVPLRFIANAEEGFIVAELNLKPLSEVVTRFRFGTTGKVYIFDRQGRLIIDPDLSLVLKDPTFIDRPIVRSLAAGGQAVDDATYVNENNVPVRASGIALSQFGWGIVSEQASREADALRDKIFLLVAASIFASIMLLGMLVVNARKLVTANVRLRSALSDLSRMNELLEAANAKLKELDRQKSEFVSIAGHQLRAPLTVIKGYTSLLLEGTVGDIPSGARELLEKIAFSTEQLVKLVAGLLDLARIEAGKIKYEMRTGDLGVIAREVLGKFKDAAAKKGVALVFDDRAGGDAKFVFDQDKIREAIINYVDNAVKYTERGSVTVALERVGEGTGGRIRLSVTDTGLGMKPSDANRLFEKFVRTHEAQRTDPNGLGIGLYFLKRVIQDHGGTVGAASPGVGKGSTFWFDLPVKK